MHLKRWDIVIIGSIHTDYLMLGSKLPRPGETVTGEKFFTGIGGRGANQAVAAARLGARVALISRVGSDPRGDAIVAHLTLEGVDTRFVSRNRSQQTGMALLMVRPGGEIQAMNSPAAAHRLTRNDVREAADEIAAARVLILHADTPVQVMKAAAAVARKAGTRVLLDTAPPLCQPMEKIIRLADIVRLSGQDAFALTGSVVRNRSTARKAAQALLKQGLLGVAITTGQKGHLLAWRDSEAWLPPSPLKMTEPTGADDAFLAALAVRIAENKSFPEAGQFAIAAAALAATGIGAQTALPRRAAVLAHLARTAPARPETPPPTEG